MSKILDIQKKTLETKNLVLDPDGVIGRAHPIKESRNMVTGKLEYVGDIKLPNMLYAKELYSPHPHAIIKDIDISKAEALEGVRAVICHKNVTDKAYNSSRRFWEQELPENEQIYSKRVRYVGDRVAAVAADTLEIAKEAIKLIEVEYEVLEPVFDSEEALDLKSPKLHGDSNLVGEMKSSAGNIDRAFKDAYRIYEGVYEVPPIHHAAMENHVAIGDYDYRGKLTIYTPCQNVFAFRLIISQLTDIPIHKVRVVRPSIGGSFGGKLETVLEPVVALLSIRTKRPVRLELTRTESIISTKTRHGAKTYIKTAVDKEGKILGQDFDIILNTGAYAGSAMNVLGALSHKIYKVYKTENMRFRGRAVMTNIPEAGAMRGYGSPQAFFGQQIQMREIAKDLGLDLLDLQRKNLVDPDGVDVRFNSPILNPRVKDALERGSELFAWDDKKTELIKDGDIVEGIGMAIGAHGNGVFGAHRDCISLLLSLNEDGSLTLNTGVHDMGQGNSTVQAMIIAEELGITTDWIETIEADTDSCLWNLGDYASRGTYVEGGATKKLVRKLKLRMLEIAKEILGSETENLMFYGGCIIDGEDLTKRVSFNQVAIYSQREYNKELSVIEDYSSPAGETSYGVHFAKVRVDKKQKTISVLDYVAVHDVGKVINPMGLEGQLEGAIMIGIGQALMEGFSFDENGKTLTRNFRTYPIPRIGHIPNCKIDFIEEGSVAGPYGAKSIGECSVVPSIPAVVNAVADALDLNIRRTPIDLNDYVIVGRK